MGKIEKYMAQGGDNEKNEQTKAETNEGAGKGFVRPMRDVSCAVEQGELQA